MPQIETSMSSKYQVTIPFEIREEIGIDSPDYDIVWIKMPSGHYILKPKKKLGKAENPFLRLYGILAHDDDKTDWVDEFIQEKRIEALKENL